MSGRSNTPSLGKLTRPATVSAMNSMMTGTGLRMDQVTKFMSVVSDDVDQITVFQEAGTAGNNGGAGSQATHHFYGVALDDAGLHHLPADPAIRSEEHTSELQSRENLVCRLL